MINETSGVLEAPDHSHCYFELEDLNIESRVGMEDLAATMAGTSGMLINYQVLGYFHVMFMVQDFIESLFSGQAI